MDMKKLQKVYFDVVQDKNIKYRTYHIENILDKEDKANGSKIVVCTERIDKDKVKVGAAFCSPLDKKYFVRKFGQYVAYERIQKGKMVIVDLSSRPSDTTVHEFLKSSILELAGNTKWMLDLTSADIV